MISLQMFFSINNKFPISLTLLNAETINIHCTIRDSITHDSISLVQVTVENLNKSFKTRRSSFYAALPAETYSFLLEADGYDTLRKSIKISLDNNDFILEMVKLVDRAKLKELKDSLNHYSKAFDNALNNGEFAEAKRLITMLKKFNCPDSVVDSHYKSYEATKTNWTDSLLTYAQALEDSQKLVDAYFYYKKIVDIDSLNEGVLEKLNQVNEKLKEKGKEKEKEKEKGKNSQPSTIKQTMTPEAIEEIFNKGVSKYLAEDYKNALKLFRKVLKYNPGHERAKKYLDKTVIRLKAGKD